MKINCSVLQKESTILQNEETFLLSVSDITNALYSYLPEFLKSVQFNLNFTWPIYFQGSLGIKRHVLLFLI